MVCAGETDRDAIAATLPIPLSMVTVVAPETAHDKVDEPPVLMLRGEAVKEVIEGGATGLLTFTVTVAVTLPALLLAVNV